MSSTHVDQQRASLWHYESVVGMMSRVRGNTGAKSPDQRQEWSKLVTEEMCYKYLSGAQPCLQLSALLL